MSREHDRLKDRTSKFIEADKVVKELRPTLGAQLRAARESVGVAAKFVAEEAQVSRPHLCDVEKGKKPMTGNIATAYRSLVIPKLGKVSPPAKKAEPKPAKKKAKTSAKKAPAKKTKAQAKKAPVKAKSDTRSRAKAKAKKAPAKK